MNLEKIINSGFAVIALIFVGMGVYYYYLGYQVTGFFLYILGVLNGIIFDIGRKYEKIISKLN